MSLIFITKWVREDVVAVLALSALILLGLVEPAEALSGFGSNAVVSIVALLIVSAGLVRSGAVNWIAARIQDLAGGKRKSLLILSFLIPGILSGFINIVGAVSVLIPLLLRIAKKNDIHPSRLLMPAVASGMAGANLSLIGASHNLVVNDLIQNRGLRAFDFFEFTLVGIIFVAATVLYSRLAGPHLLKEKPEAPPKSEKESDQEIVGAYRLQARIWEVWIQPESKVVGGVCMALTQPLHNAIVAVIMTPVALDFANSINANPRAFAVAVVVGASATFLMPVGHPASVLVQKPGSYRPKDYFIFGIGPCLIALATIGIVVPWIWPFGQ